MQQVREEFAVCGSERFEQLVLTPHVCVDGTVDDVFPVGREADDHAPPVRGIGSRWMKRQPRTT